MVAKCGAYVNAASAPGGDGNSDGDGDGDGDDGSDGAAATATITSLRGRFDQEDDEGRCTASSSAAQVSTNIA